MRVTRWHNDAFSVTGEGASGATQAVRFERCLAEDAPNEALGGLPGERDSGFEIEDGCADVVLVECVVRRAGGNGFVVRNHEWPHAVETSRVGFSRCEASALSGHGFAVRAASASVRDVVLADCRADGACRLDAGAGVVVRGGSIAAPAATPSGEFRFAWHLTGDRHAAEDLVQTTFLTAIEAAGAFEAGQRVVPWLVGILANRAREARRRARQRTALPGAIAAERPIDPVEEAAARELGDTVRDRLRALDEPYREVLALHLERGLGAKEIAESLGRPAATVRSQILRGLERLRRALPASLAAGARAGAPVPLLGDVRAVVLARAGGELAAAGAVPTFIVLGALLMKKSVVIPVSLALACVLTCPLWSSLLTRGSVGPSATGSGAMPPGPASAHGQNVDVRASAGCCRARSGQDGASTGARRARALRGGRQAGRRCRGHRAAEHARRRAARAARAHRRGRPGALRRAPRGSARGTRRSSRELDEARARRRRAGPRRDHHRGRCHRPRTGCRRRGPADCRRLHMAVDERLVV